MRRLGKGEDEIKGGSEVVCLTDCGGTSGIRLATVHVKTAFMHVLSQQGEKKATVNYQIFVQYYRDQGVIGHLRKETATLRDSSARIISYQ